MGDLSDGCGESKKPSSLSDSDVVDDVSTVTSRTITSGIIAEAGDVFGKSRREPITAQGSAVIVCCSEGSFDNAQFSSW